MIVRLFHSVLFGVELTFLLGTVIDRNSVRALVTFWRLNLLALGFLHLLRFFLQRIVDFQARLMNRALSTDLYFSTCVSYLGW